MDGRIGIDWTVLRVRLEFREFDHETAGRRGSRLRISTRLAPIALIDSATGEPVRLGDLWRDRLVVLIFLRHFG
jgi:hypothetical protein